MMHQAQPAIPLVCQLVQLGIDGADGGELGREVRQPGTDEAAPDQSDRGRRDRHGGPAGAAPAGDGACSPLWYQESEKPRGASRPRSSPGGRTPRGRRGRS